MTVTLDTRAPRSRRSLLAAAAGSFAAVAASAVVPAAALAHDAEDVQKGADNGTTTVTSITQATSGANAFEAYGKGAGAGVVGTTDAVTQAGVVGLAGATSGAVYYGDGSLPIDAGVYGYASQDPAASGILGEGPTGVHAFGDWGVYADGYSVGVYAGAIDGTALHAHVGAGSAPAEVRDVALRATVTSLSQVGLEAHGRIQLPNRSGRVSIAAGQSAKPVTVGGVTAANLAIAVLNTNASGYSVRAVVPSTNRITIYLNKAATSTLVVAWLVLG